MRHTAQTASGVRCEACLTLRPARPRVRDSAATLPLLPTCGTGAGRTTSTTAWPASTTSLLGRWYLIRYATPSGNEELRPRADNDLITLHGVPTVPADLFYKAHQECTGLEPPAAGHRSLPLSSRCVLIPS